MYLDGSFDYVPDPDFTGVDVFTYEVKDPDDLTDQATVTITVSPVNDAPVATDDAYDVTDPGGAVVAQSNGLLSNDSDADGDPLTAILVSAPTTGLLNLATDGSFDYVPAAHFDGVETFTYEVSDGLLVSDVATVEMRVFVAWDTADTGGTTAPTDTGCPATTWFVDADGDGFGNDDMTFDACDQPLGTTDIGGDCDDSLASAFPGADEIASDGVDQDCDGADAGVAGTGTEGCGCDATGASWSAWSLGLLVLAFRRRGRPIC